MATGEGRTPRISVVMPVRDGEAYLAEAVESILSQTFADFEFIIIDDGSKDRTPDILKEFAKRHSRIRLHRIEGRGIVAALNLGIAVAQSEYIARMDADDIALPQRFAVQLEQMDADPDLLVLGSAAIEIDTNGAETGRSRLVAGSGDVRAALAFRCALIHPTVLARREPVVAVGGYRQALTYAEDYDLWLRLARIGPLANSAEPLLKLRRHPTQISRIRSLEQRGAAALARRLAFDRAEPVKIELGGSPGQAMAEHLRSRHRSRKPISDSEAKDLSVMLRACSRLGTMDTRSMREIGSRIVSEGRLPRGWILPLKLWLRW